MRYCPECGRGSPGKAGECFICGTLLDEDTTPCELPCLSIRQPWAWLVVNGFKDIENRTWRTGVRGRIFVHAGKTMTREEYEACEYFIHGFSEIQLPSMFDLERGGIVGEVSITDCVDHHSSNWFCGPIGFVLAAPKVLRFRPCPGMLHFWQPQDVRGEVVP